MKIGLVLSSTPAYSETFFNSKIKGLQKFGFEVVLFVQNNDPNFKLCKVKKSYKVYKNPLLQLISMFWVFVSLIPYLQRVCRFIKLERKLGISVNELFKRIYLNAYIFKEQLDWLHFGFATIALGKEHVAKSIGAKMAVSFRGYDINVYPLKFPNCYHTLWNTVDKVHSISKYLLEKAYELGLSENVPFEIISPAVNLENKIDVKKIKSLRKIKLVTIARLHWMKGLDVAIAAVKLLKDQGIEIEYTIVGGGEQKELERYQFQTYELGLKEAIFFLGALSHIKTLQVLNEHEIYVQPSLNEGFCNALLEAQAYGKLCVAFNVGALSENIIDGKTGWLVSNRSPEYLADKIKEVFKLPNELKQEVIINAQNRVKNEFSIEQQQEKFVKFYES